MRKIEYCLAAKRFGQRNASLALQDSLIFDPAALPAGAKKIDKPKVVSAQGKKPPAK